MAESTINNKIDAYAQFEKWLSEQPYWLQDAAYRIYHNMPIDDMQISKYADLCVSQVKKERSEYSCLAKNESKQENNCSKMAVCKLFDIKGVNALAPDAELEFSENGITVIYGLNGAGKSGFMRIFKLLSGSPYEEAIQPNVFKKGQAENPSCKVLISEEGSPREVYCNLASGKKDSPLVNCDVFDTRISNSYITKTNNVSYQPFVFTVLSELSDVADRINKHIIEREKTIPDYVLTIPEEFSDREDLTWIKNLNADSLFPVQYKSWSDQQQKDFEEIPKKLDTENVTGKISLNNTLLGNIKPVADNLIRFNNAIKSPELAQTYQAFDEAKNKRDIAEKLFTDTADDYDKISASTSEWRNLWSIAVKYYESSLCKNGINHFGEEGTICPLCHQIITGHNVTRFKSINEYVNGTCSEEYNNEKNKMVALLAGVFDQLLSVEQIRSLLSNIFDENEIAAIEAVFESIGNKKTIENVDTEYNRILMVNAEPALKILIDKKQSLKNKILHLEKCFRMKGV